MPGRNILRIVTLQARVPQRVFVSEPCTVRVQNAAMAAQLYYVREDDDSKSYPIAGGAFDTSRAKWPNGPGVCNLSAEGGYWFYYDSATSTNTLTLAVETNDGGNAASLDEEGSAFYATHGTVTVDTTVGGVPVLSANRQRKVLYFCNKSSTVDVFLGFGFNPTSTDGFMLKAGSSMMLTDGLNYRGAIRAIVASTTAVLLFGEGV